jgi:hypothetical protein
LRVTGAQCLQTPPEGNALTKHLRAAGVTPMMTMEIPELLGTA